MNTIHTPSSIAAPSSAYAHGIKSTDSEVWMHVSGQVGTLPDGSLAGDTQAQMEVCWDKIFAILADGGMDKRDIVKVVAYLTNADEVGLYRGVRDEKLERHIAASTLLVVSALADPAWTVEIEAIAAK